MYDSRLASPSRPSPGPRAYLTLVREPQPPYAVAAADGPDPRSQTPLRHSRSEPGHRSTPDELLELGDRIAEIARSIQAAEGEMMRLIVEFDRRRGWAEAGFTSCAEWLAWRIGIGLNAARERVRTARALIDLPEASAAIAAGDLSYAKARALTRVATPASETDLLELARAGSADNLERVVRSWKAMNDAEELSAERLRHRRRRLSVFVDDDGSYVVKGRLDPEAGAVLMRAIDAASDAVYRRGAGDEETTAAQRRADAMGLLAERALAEGFGGDRGDRGAPVDRGGRGDRPGQGPVDLQAPRGSRADRYQVMLYVDADTLRADRPSGRSELDGVRICRETSRRLTCDAGVTEIERAVAGRKSALGRSSTPDPTSDAGEARDVTAVTRPDGPRGAAVPPMNGQAHPAGRRRRTVSPALRRALLTRDRGCRFPGCGSRFTEAHHIVHWADGGPTELSNLVLLCRRHHRAVHENGMRICMDRERAVVFYTAAGRPLAGAPAPGSTRPAHPLPPAPPPPSSPMSPAIYPGAARFRRDRDIPWSIEAQVREALDTG